MKKFCCSYRMNGHEYAFDIFAEDLDDAERRMYAIRNWGKIDGEVLAELPVMPGTGLLTRFLCWARNMFVSPQ